MSIRNNSLLTGVCCACIGFAVNASPVISKESLQFEFARIGAMSNQTNAMEIANAGDTPLEIHRVRACCGATYNGENRPIYWSNGVTNIVMSFDRMGRRVQYLETSGATTNANNTFTYDNYLCIARNRALPDASTETDHFIWDPTEPIATRPLVFNYSTATPAYYTHDGNKNVSEVIASNGILSAHYECAPFGSIIVQVGASASENPWRYSSEYVEDGSVTVYFNYRHYETTYGRWLSRDPSSENFVLLYVFADNDTISSYDYIGLDVLCGNSKYESGFRNLGVKKVSQPIKVGTVKLATGKTGSIIAAGRVVLSDLSFKTCCKCMPQTKGGPRYALMVELKSSYYIEIVKVGARWYGGKKRSVKGYERTLSHEQLHVQEFQSLFDSILKSFSEGGLHTREKCNEKRNEAIEKFNKSKSEWNYQKMNQATHSGKSWDEWRRSNGHSETSEELW